MSVSFNFKLPRLTFSLSIFHISFFPVSIPSQIFTQTTMTLPPLPNTPLPQFRTIPLMATPEFLPRMHSEEAEEEGCGSRATNADHFLDAAE